jgi:hypothetical protein
MTGRRIITAGAAAIVLGAALPSVAAADDYCVAPKVTCGTGNVADLETALTDAKSHAGADRVLLDPGTYVAAGPLGFQYASFDPVEIVGAGPGQTVLTTPPGSGDQVLQLLGGPVNSVRDLTIRIPAKVKSGFKGLYSQGVARRIEIEENPDQPNQRWGARIDAPGVLEDSSVDVGAGGTGVWLTSADVSKYPNVVRRSVVTAGRGVFADGGGAIDGSYVTGTAQAVVSQGGTLTMAHSVARGTGFGSTALYAATVGSNTAVDVDDSTIVASKSGSTGIFATTEYFPGIALALKIRSSIVQSPVPIVAKAPGPAKATIETSWSSYDPNAVIKSGQVDITATGVQNPGALGFVDAGNGDYRLLPGSPMIDAGDPAAPQGLDLGGNPLVVDGNGDGTTRRDIGAYEFQPPAASPSPDTQAPVISRFRASRSRLRYALSEKARVSVRIQRRLGGRHARYRTLGKLSANARQGANRTRVSARLRRLDARPGRYRVVIAAVDAAGNRSATKTASFRVRR